MERGSLVYALGQYLNCACSAHLAPVGTVGFRKSTQAKRPSTLRGASSNEEGQSIEELREAFERAVAKVAKAEKALNDPFSQVLPFVKAQREKNLERAEEVG